MKIQSVIHERYEFLHAETKKDSVFVFDYYAQIKLPIFKKYGRLSLFGAAYNIADTNYIYRSVWPQPGRWVEGGIRFGF